MNCEDNRNNAKYTSALVTESRPSHTEVLSCLFPDYNSASHDHVGEMVPPRSMMFSSWTWYITYDVKNTEPQQEKQPTGNTTDSEGTTPNTRL